jgi:uncharacterized protein YndB with AHSA1/START domain
MCFSDPRTKERQMTSGTPGGRLLGSLHSVDGKGVVRMEESYDSGVDEVWSALTDAGRLAGWYGEVEGDLRPGGVFHIRVFASGAEGMRRVDACEPAHRLRVVNTDSGELVIEVTLSPDGDRTNLGVEVSGMPLDALAAYGAGVQIHVEDLTAYLAGRDRDVREARWDELIPAYQNLSTNPS